MSSRSGRRRRNRIRWHDHGRCFYCGASVPLADGVPDHVWPRSKGGPDAHWNMVWCCKECNQDKGDADLVDYRPDLVGRFLRRKNRIIGSNAGDEHG